MSYSSFTTPSSSPLTSRRNLSDSISFSNKFVLIRFPKAHILSSPKLQQKPSFGRSRAAHFTTMAITGYMISFNFYFFPVVGIHYVFPLFGLLKHKIILGFNFIDSLYSFSLFGFTFCEEVDKRFFHQPSLLLQIHPQSLMEIQGRFLYFFFW